MQNQRQVKCDAPRVQDFLKVALNQIFTAERAEFAEIFPRVFFACFAFSAVKLLSHMTKKAITKGLFHKLPLTALSFLRIITSNIRKAMTEESTSANAARDVWSNG